MKHWRDCNCTGAIFVQHIINHLRVGEEVVCKICKKTVAEIAAESSQPVIEADAEKPCGTNYDCHYRKAIIHDSRCPKFRTA